MAKTICKILGVVFLLVGILGFLAPGLLGMHLSLAHNLVHLISGALALYFGFSATLSAARLFCIAFGVVYGLLGIAGFLLGHGGTHTVDVPPDGGDTSLFAALPGSLELASMDHIVHILLAAIFLIGGFLTKADVRRAVD
ncbi:MAG: DUF4383 domain-containing protein [Pyrinomonadaceae bacterium]